VQAVITRPVHGAHRDQVRGADPTGLCTDPGGPGARYCIDAFIAQGVTNFGFKTDDHVGPKSDGGTYRFELTFRREQNGNVSYEAKRGTSVLDFLGVHLEEPAEIIRCDAMGGSSSIVAGCIAGDGIGGGLAPKVGSSSSSMTLALTRAWCVGPTRVSPRLRSGDTRTIRTPS